MSKFLVLTHLSMAATYEGLKKGVPYPIYDGFHRTDAHGKLSYCYTLVSAFNPERAIRVPEGHCRLLEGEEARTAELLFD